MRCSKVKIVVVLLICSIIVGLEMFLLHSKGDEQSLRELSSKFRSEEKPSESWISGKINLYYDSDTINVETQACKHKIGSLSLWP